MASDDEETNTNENESQEGKSGTIFLIDSSYSMFNKDMEDGDQRLTRMNLALKCCKHQLLNKIIAKQKDLVGVVLFGTDKSDPETNTKNVSLLLELNYPGAPAIKKLDELLKDDDSQKIQSDYGSSGDFFLADALWFCSSLLSRSRQHLDEKRILLFTDNSDPHEDHPDRAHMARKRAKDLNKVKISLEVIPIGGTVFNYSTFYQELVETVRGQPESEDFYPESSSRLEELLDRVNRYEFRRRRYAKIKWNLGNDVFLGVSLYTLYSEASVLSTQSLSRTTNEPVTKVKQTYDETGELLLPSDIVEYLSIGGIDIEFSRDEKDALLKVMQPGLILLGFKPSSVVTEGQHCGKPTFIYPEETLMKGSRRLMKALVERCVAKEKVAVCCMTPRYRAVTKYFYLVPSEETYDSDGSQLTPCGFHAIPIPFDCDVREQVFDHSSDVPSSTLEIVKRVVNKLKMSYKPSDFENPKLQQFWNHLEALALEDSAPETPVDSTIPDFIAQTERLGNLVQEFNSACELNGGPTTLAKREVISRDSAGPSKRVKKDEVIDIDAEIKAAIKAKKVDKFTVAQLKEFLNIHNIKSSSLKKKADLVEAIYQMKV